ncbi:putative holin [Pseudomonas aeruginosa]|nr:putative holin [Pseudomonas aeruginosa]
MTSWTLVTPVLLIILAAIRPEQLQVVAYKLVLVTLGAVAGYWIDRSLFPYVARPHECSANLVVVGAWLRRGLIVLACILGLTLGLTMGVPQIIWIVLASVVLVTSYACDGLTNVISFKQRVFDVIAMTALVGGEASSDEAPAHPRPAGSADRLPAGLRDGSHPHCRRAIPAHPGAQRPCRMGPVGADRHLCRTGSPGKPLAC